MLNNSRNLRFRRLFKPFNIPFHFLATLLINAAGKLQHDDQHSRTTNRHFSRLRHLAKSHTKSHT
jgi:hypothetical protein